jgi:signal transduction histidine kinase
MRALRGCASFDLVKASGRDRARRWVSFARRYGDPLLAVALLTAALVELAAFQTEHLALELAVAPLITLPVAWRRRAPLGAVAVAAVGLVAAGVSGADPDPNGVIVAVLLLTYTAAARLGLWRALVALGLVYAGVAGVTLEAPADLAFISLFVLPWWVGGRVLRDRRTRIAELERVTTELQREREERARLAVEAERTRIARELHDIVSHSISVIAVQSQAVRHRLGPEHAREAEDLEAVEATARQAMAEMRRLFGVLRRAGSSPSLAPQPGLDQLPRLLEETRQAGVPVEVNVEGERVPLPPGVDLAAYRVVQEALTNVRRHAGGANATITLAYGRRDLDITVVDDGDGAAPAASDRGGLGLIGMRERVSLYGGDLETGVRPTGGFRVHVRLPFRERGV